jgi:hypothetical protein
MAADEETVRAPPLGGEQVLDELDFLAGVEHSLCVEYLSVHCALGHRLDAADEGATARHVAEAAQAAAVLAQDEMRHVHNVNRALVQPGDCRSWGARRASVGTLAPRSRSAR